MQSLSSEYRKVLPGSPAEKAGLLPGDQLIAAEGIEIREVKEIHHALSEKGWGKDITLAIHREGKNYRFNSLLQKTKCHP